MNVLQGAKNYIAGTLWFSSIPCGALDVIVLEKPPNDGGSKSLYRTTPFHVRFAQGATIRDHQKQNLKIVLVVNDKPVELTAELGAAGEVFFENIPARNDKACENSDDDESRLDSLTLSDSTSSESLQCHRYDEKTCTNDHELGQNTGVESSTMHCLNNPTENILSAETNERKQWGWTWTYGDLPTIEENRNINALCINSESKLTKIAQETWCLFQECPSCGTSFNVQQQQRGGLSGVNHQIGAEMGGRTDSALSFGAFHTPYESVNDLSGMENAVSGSGINTHHVRSLFSINSVSTTPISLKTKENIHIPVDIPELSLCGTLVEGNPSQQMLNEFRAHLVPWDSFSSMPMAFIADPNLRVLMNGRISNLQEALPHLIALSVYHKTLVNNISGSELDHNDVEKVTSSIDKETEVNNRAQSKEAFLDQSVEASGSNGSSSAIIKRQDQNLTPFKEARIGQKFDENSSTYMPDKVAFQQKITPSKEDISSNVSGSTIKPDIETEKVASNCSENEVANENRVIIDELPKEESLETTEGLVDLKELPPVGQVGSWWRVGWLSDRLSRGPAGSLEGDKCRDEEFRETGRRHRRKNHSGCRSLCPSSEDLEALNLQKGLNLMQFLLVHSFKMPSEPIPPPIETVTARVFLWKSTAKVVVLSEEAGLLSVPQQGAREFYKTLLRHGYHVVRVGVGGRKTRSNSQTILSDIPILKSPGVLFGDEDISSNIDSFAYAALNGLRNLFQPEMHPFHAGFCTSEMEVNMFEKVGVPPARIFRVNTSAQVTTTNRMFQKTWKELTEMALDIFPPLVENLLQPVSNNYSDVNFWRNPPANFDPSELLSTNKSSTI